MQEKNIKPAWFVGTLLLQVLPRNVDAWGILNNAQFYFSIGVPADRIKKPSYTTSNSLSNQCLPINYI